MRSGDERPTANLRGSQEPETRELEAEDLIGRRVGGYELRERIGAGGMGAVYLGVHPTLDRRVAVKVILAEHAGNEELRRRFFEEGKLAASIDHPNVVAIHDLAQLPDGRCYMVMEYLDGESLSRRLRAADGRLESSTAVAIAAQALEGLAALHERGLVHRDIKPSNLFLVRTSDGEQVKLLDFGIAKLRGDDAPKITRTGAVVGTPGYMAPEQASGGGDVDGRADLYALGVILYEMLAGRSPFETDDWVEMLYLHRRATPPPLDGVDPALAKVVERAMAKQPSDRYPSAGDMHAALVAAVGEIGALSAPPATPAPRARRIAAALSAVLAAAAVAVAVALTGGSPASTADPDAAPAIAVDDPLDAATTAVADGADASATVATVAAPDAAAPKRTHRSRLRADAGATAPPRREPAPESLTTSGPENASRFDIAAGIPHARKHARRIHADAELVYLRGWGVMSNGAVDLTGNGYVSYTFRSPSASRGAKIGSVVQCLVQVRVGAKRTQVVPTHSDCREPLWTPRCTARDLWKAALAAGRSADQLGGISYNTSGLWRLNLDEGYTNMRDDECAGR